MVLTHKYDVAIVGAGILGLAAAYHLSQKGIRVAVFERTPKAVGASIRNFGMVWPIGQPAGEMREIALRSRHQWLEVLDASGIWHRKSGSLHLAYHDDELGVLEEFVQKAPASGYECSLLTPTEVAGKSSVVRMEGLRGAMWSAQELCVFPRQVVWELPTFLMGLGVEFHYGVSVTHVEEGMVIAGGEEIAAEQVLICSGDDFETLFPDRFAAFGMTRSKLQMLRAKPKRSGYEIGAHLCAGLTLGHYANFRLCDRLAEVVARHGRELPEHAQWGIHLLVSQHEDGCLTIGDSHEYGLAVDPFLSEHIEHLILEYLDTFLPTEDFDVIERWHGVYAKHPSRNYLIECLLPGVTLLTGVGGAGMTLSFGIAENALRFAGILS